MNLENYLVVRKLMEYYHFISKVMRITFLLLTVFLVQVSARTNAQININEKNASLRKIIKQIAKQTGYDFVFADKDLAKASPVSVNLENVSLDLALKRTFAGQPLTYHIDERTVILSGMPQVPARTVNATGTAVPIQEYITVNGTVQGTDGVKLQGASIKALDTKGNEINLYASSDSNGDFVLNKVPISALLEFSFVGYQKRILAARTQMGIVSMQAVTAQIEEIQVVNTGYQSLPKERSTGAFDIIDKKVLETPRISLANKLVGASAGLQPSFDANGKASFVLRGKGTFGGSAPLLVVDGFAINGGFESINPNDVESISILKDAAAASIWGARANNGVIVVTTKNAKKSGKLRIDFSNQLQVGSMYDIDYLRNQASSEETVNYERATFGKYQYKTMMGGMPPVNVKEGISLPYSQAQTLYNQYFYKEIDEKTYEDGLYRLSQLDNTQQIKNLLTQRPITQQYSFSLASPSERMSNYASLLYNQERSGFVGNKNRNMQMDYRGQAAIASWLDFSLSSMFRYQEADNSGVSSGDITELHRYDMLIGENGQPTNMNYLRYYQPLLNSSVPMSSFPYSDWSYNILNEMKSRELKSSGLNLRVQGGLDFKLGYGIRLETKFMFERLQYDNRNLYYEDSYFVRNLVNTSAEWNKTTGAIRTNIPKGQVLDQNTNATNAYNWRNQLNLNRTFAEIHEVNALVGAEIIQRNNKRVNMARTYGYSDDQLTVGILPNGTGNGLQLTNWLGNRLTIPYTNAYGYAMDRYFSSYGNMAYTYDRKYTLSGSFRIDASNFISDEPKYLYSPFWSIGGSWNLKNENFLLDNTRVNALKLRSTYGYNGSSNTETSFKPLIQVNGVNAESGHMEAQIHSYGNPTLRWERTGTLNLGVDYELLNGRLFGKLDYYRKHGKDILAYVSIPLINGTYTANFNSAEILNNGIELEIGSRWKNGNGFYWEGVLNMAYNHNEVKKLLLVSHPYWHLSGSGGTTYVEGRPMSAVYSFRYAGPHNFGTEGSPQIRPAVYLKDGEVMDIVSGQTQLDGLEFMAYQGASVAPYTLGMRHSFGYRDFDLSFSLIAKLGHIYRKTPFNHPGRNGQPNSMLNTARTAEPEGMLPALPYNENDALYSVSYSSYMDYLTTSANHLRINDITLSYNLKQGLSRVVKLERAQLFAQTNNLTIKGKGEDPEFLYGRMRLLPSFMLGIKVGF
ncbi:TonB-linked outer membrane protein, SusC/RagA family [Sphingobacterium nematocida]|uniref:TonB-linked outer membrane protein, SusC/RagA family n=1 Tax=Sphingobacterium nematocida TaxID=1513896 RepID=A0A1T5G022_9SPHI|nr:SusC/RagA family TonB-linked outer membrane protein [Sphingobacterium nematocida]SKC01778.1 TonB-linked outer membrane protein, SusC/RagA family [Sphingobacterium nematocida]